jgi:hypothetical protein
VLGDMKVTAKMVVVEEYFGPIPIPLYMYYTALHTYTTYKADPSEIWCIKVGIVKEESPEMKSI